MQKIKNKLRSLMVLSLTLFFAFLGCAYHGEVKDTKYETLGYQEDISQNMDKENEAEENNELTDKNLNLAQPDKASNSDQDPIEETTSHMINRYKVILFMIISGAW